jgi:nucleotide-binding universal stress UspA family protein
VDEPRLTHVLAAVDFSEWTPPVLQTAAGVAAMYGAALTALYAETFLPPPYFTEAEVHRLAAVLEEQREAARRALGRAVAGALGSTERATVRLVEAAPATGILEVAADLPADLLVLGTHGRGGVDRLLLGSVAEKVVRRSAAPVLTVRSTRPPRLPWRRILCPVNSTPVAGEALRWAAGLAHRSAAELIVLASAEDGAPSSPQLREEDLCGLVPAAARGGCSVQPLVRRGEAAEQILQTAAEEDCDLLVLGAQHRPLLEATILGTTSVRVMRHASCSVLTVFRSATAAA